MAHQEPRIGDVGVMALVPDRWAEKWQSRHHILTRLSEYFHVVWVNPAYGLRSREWRGRWMRRDASEHARHVPPTWGGLTISEPGFLLPSVGRPRFVGKMLDRPRLRLAHKLLTGRGCKRIIVHIWRPEFARMLDLVDYDLACYHIDDEYSFSDVDLPLDKAEAQLISKVDQVFVSSPGLLEKKGMINPHTAFVPNGVDYQVYASALPEPPDMRSIPHPRIGYSGVIKWTLDWPLLHKLSLQHPHWQFVFVGQQSHHDSRLEDAIGEMSRRPNAHFLGAKNVWEIAAYPQHFDVCVMPYRPNSHSMKYGYPLKLHEYLATGRPTVGTPLRSLLEFRSVIRLAWTLEEWSRALTQSLAADAMDPSQIEARRAVARRHDWGSLVGLIAHTLCERLGPSYLERLRSIPAAGSVATLNRSD